MKKLLLSAVLVSAAFLGGRFSDEWPIARGGGKLGGDGTPLALSQLGVDIQVLALLAAGALALGLALQGPVSSIIAGLVLFIRRPFRVGDEVIIAGVTGIVKGTGSFAVVMDEPNGTRTVVPNHLVLREPIRITKRED